MSYDDYTPPYPNTPYGDRIKATRSGEELSRLIAERDQLRADNERLTKELAASNDCTEFYAQESDAHCNEREKLRADLADARKALEVSTELTQIREDQLRDEIKEVNDLRADLARAQAALEAYRLELADMVTECQRCDGHGNYRGNKPCPGCGDARTLLMEDALLAARAAAHPSDTTPAVSQP